MLKSSLLISHLYIYFEVCPNTSISHCFLAFLTIFASFCKSAFDFGGGAVVSAFSGCIIIWDPGPVMARNGALVVPWDCPSNEATGNPIPLTVGDPIPATSSRLLFFFLFARPFAAALLNPLVRLMSLLIGEVISIGALCSGVEGIFAIADIDREPLPNRKETKAETRTFNFGKSVLRKSPSLTLLQLVEVLYGNPISASKWRCSDRNFASVLLIIHERISNWMPQVTKNLLRVI